MKGEITTWDHQDIKAENPNLNVPAGTTIKARVGRWRCTLDLFIDFV
jgi:hypothetical protein